MRINKSKLLFLLLYAVSELVSGKGAALGQITLPGATELCPTNKQQKTDFAKWLQTVASGNTVQPPSNLKFTNTNDCDFYMLAERMFIWLTSPVPGDNLRVFETPSFYQVSPADAQNNRQLLVNSADLNRPNPNTPSDRSKLKKASVSINQFDMGGATGIVADNDQWYSFVGQQTSASGAPIVRNRADGLQTEIERTKVAEDGGPRFIDKFGRSIPFAGRPDGLLRDSFGNPIDFDRSFRKFFKGEQAFFLDQSGSAIETERGAGKPLVLMAQKKLGLVYYTIEVNDVYAYFLTGTKTVLAGSTTPAIVATHLPSEEKPDLLEVERFARRKFADRETLGVEIKFAWIEAAGLADIGNYITTWANIPKFEKDQANPKHLKNAGWKPTKLAMVGMHIAFNVQGNAQMVWTTFEHVQNAPNPAYCYIDGTSGSKVNPPNLGGRWLFSSVGSRQGKQNKECKKVENGSVNIAHMYTHGGDIFALPDGHKLEPSNVLRLNPWGVEPNDDGKNTAIISLNKSVHDGLTRGDVRRNYVSLGTTWMRDGFQEGTEQLANTTMETFFQSVNVNYKRGCLACHQGSPENMLGSISHIYCATGTLVIAGSTQVPGPGCRSRSSAPSN